MISIPRSAAPGALDLLDEAARGLRSAPVGTLGVYYAGSVPFIVALGVFLAGGGGNAPCLAALFVGMKTAQAVFAARLGAQFARRPDAPWTPARLGRLALVQAIIQPPGLFVLSAAAVVTLPLGWAYAFYGSVTALGDGSTASTRAVLGRAWRAARHDARGNHLALAVLGLLGVVAWMNLVLAMLLLPSLAQLLTGAENFLTRRGLGVFDTTFFAVTLGLVYLAFDPLAKAYYVLRCFYLEAQRTGEDLRRDLRALPPPEG